MLKTCCCSDIQCSTASSPVWWVVYCRLCFYKQLATVWFWKHFGLLKVSRCYFLLTLSFLVHYPCTIFFYDTIKIWSEATQAASRHLCCESLIISFLPKKDYLDYLFVALTGWNHNTKTHIRIWFFFSLHKVVAKFICTECMSSNCFFGRKGMAEWMRTSHFHFLHCL